MDKIHAMRVFVTVAEMESFTRAADCLGQPKGSLSRQVQALEKQTGTRLLHRTTRRVQLTQNGLAYYERCRDVLATLDEMDALFQTEPAILSGRLRVDMPVALATDIVIPQLPQFLQHYPGLQLELSSSDRQVDVIREGFDCVVRLGQLQDASLMSRTLGQLPMANCASPGYLIRFGMPLRLEDLSQHAMVHYSQQFGGAPAGFEYYDGQCLHVIQTGGALTVNSTQAYRHACLAGLGIIQAPRYAIQPLLENQQLVEVLPGLHARAMPLSLLWPHRRSLALRVRVFMEWLTQLMEGYVA